MKWRWLRFFNREEGLKTKLKKSEIREIIIHNHLFKNAGSTIDWALRKNFKKGFVDHRDDREMIENKNYLKFYLLENPHVRALSTHHLRLPLPEVPGIRLLTIMIFRHPIERVSSVYNFEKKQTQSDTLGAKFARKHDIREYVLWRMQSETPPTIRNFHVFRSLPAPVRWQQKIKDADLTKAKAYVDSLDMLGIVEHFDESMLLFENFLSGFFPNIDLSYKKQNVNQHNQDPLSIRIEKLQNQIGQSTFQLLIDQNHADLILYEHAKKVFKERLFKDTNFRANLMEFRKRCEKQIGN